ncbi:MAG: alpha amylase C-terminal domain-containing protein [Archangiaceae bacterium]|nr:alpha amylase C-terminal domain-containing protein [Archangiaceae bacterium]
MKKRLLLLIVSACGASNLQTVPHPLLDGGAADAGSDAGTFDGGPAVTPPETPFGATVGAGETQFRVWAPHATRAQLELDGAAPVAMTPEATGVFSLKVSGAGAARYRYVLETPTGSVTRLDPYCRQLSTDRAWCEVIDPGAYPWSTTGFKAAPREASVVYELHIGSFAVPAGQKQGTFATAKAKLAELADLGVNVVELMPTHAFGGNPNGWGYNPQLFLAPKPTYGTADEQRAFIDEAHRLGIAVWLDVVFNHTDGWREAPLTCFDGHCPNDAWGIHFFAPGQYASTPWGPRPNYTEPRVSSMLLDSVKQWLTEYRGDGFRFDSVSNIRALDGSGTTPGGRDLLLAANALTHAAGGLSVAEDLKGWDAITRAPSAGGFGFDAQWDGFGWEMMNLLPPASDDGRDVGVIERQLKGSYAGDAFARLLWSENHDTVGNGGSRFPVRIDGANPESLAARHRSMLAATLLFTTPGVPMLFMGQEQLATTGFTDPPAALPAPTDKGQGVRAFYRDLIALRRTLPGLRGGEVEVLHRNDTNKVIAFRRNDTIVIVNLRNKAYARYDFGVPTGGTWKVRVDSDWKRYGTDFSGGQAEAVEALDEGRDGKPFTLPVQLGAYGAVVLTK